MVLPVLHGSKSSLVLHLAYDNDTEGQWALNAADSTAASTADSTADSTGHCLASVPPAMVDLLFAALRSNQARLIALVPW